MDGWYHTEPDPDGQRTVVDNTRLTKYKTPLPRTSNRTECSASIIVTMSTKYAASIGIRADRHILNEQELEEELGQMMSNEPLASELNIDTHENIPEHIRNHFSAGDGELCGCFD